MSARQYAFTVGSIECVVLADDISHVSIERFLKRFPDATEADYRQAYAEIGLTLDAADNAFNILVAKIGDETILVDTGEGGNPYGGYLPASMQLAGIVAADITLVVLTHADGDHVQGMLTDDQQPSFPNATYVISRPEMAYWQARINAGTADQRAIVAMMQRKGLRLIAMDEEIRPGLTALPISGHTPGQIALLLEAEGEKLLHMADLLHSPMQFAHPEWSARFDVDTTISVPTRRQMLGRAADENLLTLFYHLTFPGLGRVMRVGKAFGWQAVT